MKHTWPISCSCGHRIDLQTVGSGEFPTVRCPKCGSTLAPVGDYLFHLRIFNRGYKELGEGDFTFAIILAAMSVECFVSLLYIKWRRIDFELAKNKPPSQSDEDSWEEDLKKWNNMGARFDKVCDFLTTETFDGFVANNTAAQSLFQRHPGLTASSSPKQWFQEELFKKRNRIVHRGEMDYQKPAATTCIDIGRTLLEIFAEMDEIRIARLQARFT